MSQLLKHYLLDRDNPEIFALSSSHYERSKFGTIIPNIEGLSVIHQFVQDDGVKYCLSTCPDNVEIEENDGIKIISQEEWDSEILFHDKKQEAKRWEIVKKYRDRLLSETDWIVIKSQESGKLLSEEFINWRQSLRNITDSDSFPRELPVPPNALNISIDQYEDEWAAECKQFFMINDVIPNGKTDPEWWIMKGKIPPDEAKEYFKSIFPNKVFPWSEE